MESDDLTNRARRPLTDNLADMAKPRHRDSLFGKAIKCVPVLLVATRVALGAGLVLMVVASWPASWIVALLAAAMLSDVFDGVIARRLEIATERLRVADSCADAWFFLCIGVSCWIAVPHIIRAFALPLLIELALQAGAYVYDLVRYGRIAVFHAYSAKIWGLSLYVASAGLLAFHTGFLIWVSFGFGMLSCLDAMAIKLILPEWKHDVLSAFHAMRLRDPGYLPNQKRTTR